MNKSIMSLIWVVFTDSMGWGIAFSVFASLLFSDHSTFLPLDVSDSSRYMLYEFLLAIYSVCMFIFAPVLGGIADHYGRKPGLKISMLGLTLGFLLSAMGCYWLNVWFLILGRIISGITAGSLSIAQAAAVDISTPKTKSFNLSIIMLANCLGFSLGPVLGSFFIRLQFGPVGTTTFLIGALMSIIGYVSISRFFNETYISDKAIKTADLLKDFSNIKVAFCKPNLSQCLLVLMLSMIAFGLYFSDVPIYMSRLFNADSSVTGIVLSSQAILFSIALMASGKYIFTKYEKIRVIIIAQVIQLLAYALLITSIDTLWIAVALFTVISVFAGIMYIGLLTLISDVTDADWQGRVMGVVASLSSLTWGIGPLLAGGLNHYTMGIVFLVSALLVMMGISVLIGTRKRFVDIAKAAV